MTDNEKEFLEELTKLTKQYRIVVGGCGCCGSPFIYPLTDEVNHVYVVDSRNECLTFEGKA